VVLKWQASDPLLHARKHDVVTTRVKKSALIALRSPRTPIFAVCTFGLMKCLILMSTKLQELSVLLSSWIWNKLIISVRVRCLKGDRPTGVRSMVLSW
jgi:hypothetical protein